MYEEKYPHYHIKQSDRQHQEMLERRRKMKEGFTKPDPYRFDK